MYNGFLKNQQTVIATSQTNNATTSFANVTGISFPIMASTVYLVQFDIIWQSSVNTTGISFGINGPASPTYVLFKTEIPTSLTAVTQGMVRAYDTGTATASIDTANVNSFAICYGFVSNGTTAGNLVLRVKAENANQVSVMPGTVGRLWRINPSN